MRTVALIGAIGQNQMKNLIEIYRRAIPLGLANMSLAALVFTDMAMLGHHDLSAMAAGSVMMQAYLVMLVLGEGIVFGFSPVYGRIRHGNGIGSAHIKVLSVILWLVLIFAVAGLLVLAQSDRVLISYLEDSPGTSGASTYVLLLGAACLPNLLFVVFWELLAFEERERLVLRGALVQFVANIAANYVLIFGHFGFAPLGLVGAGWATVISASIGAAVLGISCSKYVKDFNELACHLFNGAREKVNVALEILRIGLPVGITIMMTLGFLSASVVLMARFGTHAVASHSAALQISEVLVLFALGFGEFAAIRFASLGGPNRATARREVLRILTAALALFVPLVGVALLTRPYLTNVFFDAGDPGYEIVKAKLNVFALWSLPSLVVSLVLMVLQGSLRGVGITTRPAIVVLLCYWCMAVPLQVFWVSQENARALSIWHGLVIGFVMATLVLGIIWSRFFASGNERLAKA